MSPLTQAALWMTGAMLSFCGMAIGGRELSGDLDTFEIMLYRSVIGFAVVCALIHFTNRWHEITTKLIGLQITRNVVHFAGQNLWFYAVAFVPLAQVFAIEFTSPIWVIVLSPLLLGERFTVIKVCAAMIGFTGILIVARPGVIELNAGVFAAAGAAIFFALTTICTKRLTRTQPISSIMFYLTFLQLIFGLIFAGYDGNIAVPSLANLPYVLVIAAAGLVAHFCMTNALAIAPATVVVPFDFVRLPAIAVVGMLVYNEALDLWVLIGAVVIFAGNYLNIWGETRRSS